MRNNPVFRKELLTRYRLRQPRSVIYGAGAAVALVVGWIYWQGLSPLLNADDPSAGATIWAIVIIVQYLMVCAVAPSVTANAFTQEKEQHTWQMLVSTRLTPVEIVAGKLLARLIPLALILILFLPFTIFTWAHAMVGEPGASAYVSWERMLAAYVVIVVTGIFFATVGLFCSWSMQRTLYALIASYVFVFGVLFFGTGLAADIVAQFTGGGPYWNSPLLWANPIRLIGAPISPGETDNGVAVAAGLTLYASGTAALLAAMIVRFRRYERE